MKWLFRTIRQLLVGSVTGALSSLVVSLYGFTGGSGWRAEKANFAMAFLAIFALVVLLWTIVVAEWGKFFVRIDEEERARRYASVPFLMGASVTVLAIYLVTGPPTIPPLP